MSNKALKIQLKKRIGEENYKAFKEYVTDTFLYTDGFYDNKYPEPEMPYPPKYPWRKYSDASWDRIYKEIGQVALMITEKKEYTEAFYFSRDLDTMICKRAYWDMAIKYGGEHKIPEKEWQDRKIRDGYDAFKLDFKKSVYRKLKQWSEENGEK